MKGAQRAVAAALDALAVALAAASAVLDEVAIAGQLRAALKTGADPSPLRDYATTLLLAAVTPGWTAVGQIGDGAAVGHWPDGRLETMSLPQRGEYANETIPLTSLDAIVRLQVRV